MALVFCDLIGVTLHVSTNARARINAQTGKVIREIPPPELLALAKSMKEMEGVLFDEKI
jgi:hypothetical protein